ncbi:MAG: hypothetical protein KatS3mg087_1507 [Patescibacteria group bacterium]|nr:MAG: hypothetical protein KatS3mg087_1507 [Patescibacteria group bacterium]
MAAFRTVASYEDAFCWSVGIALSSLMRPSARIAAPFVKTLMSSCFHERQERGNEFFVFDFPPPLWRRLQARRNPSLRARFVSAILYLRLQVIKQLGAFKFCSRRWTLLVHSIMSPNDLPKVKQGTGDDFPVVPVPDFLRGIRVPPLFPSQVDHPVSSLSFFFHPLIRLSRELEYPLPVAEYTHRLGSFSQRCVLFRRPIGAGTTP